MTNLKNLILVNIAIFFICLDIVLFKYKLEEQGQIPPAVIQQPQQPIVQPPPLPPINYDISNPVPDFMGYKALVSQLKQWQEEAPELTELGTYGKSSKGTDLHYIRINNKRIDASKPVVLLTACTHGNESWSTTSMMAYVGTILDKYGDDEKITSLIDSRDIYLIPVVSPDTYPHSRFVDGVDPNRDFPTQRAPDKQSVAPIQALREFFLTIKPKAAISGHTSGRIFFYPWGDAQRKTPNDADYQRILGEMGRLCQYKKQQACYNYGRPIYGSEMDWYYRNGCMGMVMEFGSHQRSPSKEQVRSEFERTFDGVLYYIKEAAEVDIQLYSVLDWT